MSIIERNDLSFDDVISLIENPNKIFLSDTTKSKIIKCYDLVKRLSNEKKAVYGINTGFGPLCTKKISIEEIELLQKNLLQKLLIKKKQRKWKKDILIRY